MSDSQHLHMSFLGMLQSKLAAVDFRNLDTLAWAITGVLMRKTIHVPAWVSCLPHETDAGSRTRRFRRWLSNASIDVRQCYAPFITQALAEWPGHTLYLALDTTSIQNRLVVARTALVYRGRAVPVAWQVFKRKSVMLNFAQYAGLLQYTAQLLPRGVTVVLLGDRGFRDVRLMELAHQLHWHFRLRLAENEYAGVGRRQPVSLDTWEVSPQKPCLLQEVRLTAQRYGPVNVAMFWDGDAQHDPWRIATDQRASRQTLAEYALRMGIDFGFLDDKSAGFELADTELLVSDRLNHLLLVTALCSLYLISQGTRVVAMGQRPLVDGHWQRGLSYLQLGWRWVEYCLARDAPLPMEFCLDPAPDPEPCPRSSIESQSASDEP